MCLTLRRVMSSGTGSGSSSSAQGGAGKSVPAHGLFQFFPRGTPGGPSGMDGSKFVTPVEGERPYRPTELRYISSITQTCRAPYCSYRFC